MPGKANHGLVVLMSGASWAASGPRVNRAQRWLWATLPGATLVSDSRNCGSLWPLMSRRSTGLCSRRCPTELYKLCEQNENILMQNLHWILPLLQSTSIQQCISSHSSVVLFFFFCKCPSLQCMWYLEMLVSASNICLFWKLCTFSILLEIKFCFQFQSGQSCQIVCAV